MQNGQKYINLNEYIKKDIFMKNKFNFVYVTTNLINGKQYIGDHSTDNLNNTYTKWYIGSGRPYLINAIKKYGRENFKKEILEFFDTKKDAFNAQQKYILRYNTLVPNGYNLSPKGGHGISGCFSEETKNKLRISNLGKIRSEEIKKKQSNSHMSKKNPMYGKHLSIETKEKISKAKRGVKIGPLSEEHKLKLKFAWIKRRQIPMSDETKEKISKSSRGKSKNNKYWVGKKHSEKTKQKIKESSIGKKYSDERRKHISNGHKGQIPWNKGLKKNEMAKKINKK